MYEYIFFTFHFFTFAIMCCLFSNLKHQIDLNYLHIGKAALYCNAYFTAIIFVELWCLRQPGERTDMLNNDVLQDIMKQAYTFLGENYAVIPFLNPITSRHTYLQFNGSWNRLLIEQDVQSYRLSENIELSRRYLTSAGLYGMSNSTVMAAKNSSNSTVHYECLWRLSDWSAVEGCATSASATKTSSGELIAATPDDFLQIFEKEHYQALRCLYIKDELGVSAAITNARCAIIGFLKHASLECTNSIYRHLTDLTKIQQIEDFCKVCYFVTLFFC